MLYRSSLLKLTAIAIVTSALVSGCNKSEQQQAPTTAPEVDVVTLRTQPLTLHTELPGRTNAYRIAEVRPQVGGIVLKRLFKEGSDVKAGQVLYQIDPATYEASLASAKATLDHDIASEKTARIKADRYRDLLKNRGVSQQDYDDAEATWKEAVADIALAKAAVKTAQINLDYTKIRAPISGRIGKSSITDGALVTAAQTTVLATVQQMDPMYVDVSQSSTDLMALKKAMEAGQLEKADATSAKVNLLMNDGSTYAEAGKLEFTDITVDEGTGSVTLRAIFPNHHMDLLPGTFVRAQLSQASLKDAILVPQKAVNHDPRGNATVYVVNAKNLVEQKTFTTVQTIDSSWLVKSGLQAGDRVIVSGTQKVRAGAPATAKEVSADSLTK